MEVLEIDILWEILKFLEPKELSLILRTSKAFYAYGTMDSIWKNHCILLFPYYEKGEFYIYFKTEIWNYLKIARAFNQMICEIKSRYPQHPVYKCLRERGSTTLEIFYKNIYFGSDLKISPESVLSQFKQATGMDMPYDLYHIYMTYDGQKLAGVAGLFGTYRFYEYLTVMMLLPLKKALKKSELPFFCFAASPYSEQKILYDLTGALGKGVGAIYYNTGIRNTYLYLFSSITDFLTLYAGKLASGAIEIEPKKIDAFEWNEFCSDATTEGIRVTVKSLFIPHLSSRERYIWAYQVGIEPNGLSKRWRLQTRTWNITDSYGRVDRVVKQPGIIGHFPEVCEGSKKMTYENCCILPTTSGTMDGYFTFMNIDDETETLDAKIDTFKHKLPLGSMFVTYNL